DAVVVQHLSSETDALQERAVARRARRGRAEARQDVLLDDDPSRVALELERVANVGEGHHPASELAEDPVAHGGVIIPPLLPCALRDVARAILEVHVADASAVLRDL